MATRKPAFAPDTDWGPITYMLAVTPNDTVDLGSDPWGYGPRALYVETAGDIAMRFGDDTTVTLTSVPKGFLQVRPTRIMTATTATVLACY